MVTSISISGIRLMWMRLRRVIASDCRSSPVGLISGRAMPLADVRVVVSVVMTPAPARSSRRCSSARWPVRWRNTSSRLGRFRPRSSSSIALSSKTAAIRVMSRSPSAGAVSWRAASSTCTSETRWRSMSAAVWRSSARDTVSTRLALPLRSLSSSGVPSAMIWPRSMTTMRSASWSASSRYWVVRSSVVPSLTSPRRTSHSSTRLRGSSPVVGSSRNSTGGVAMRLTARSSRRRMPPE